MTLIRPWDICTLNLPLQLSLHLSVQFSIEKTLYFPLSSRIRDTYLTIRAIFLSRDTWGRKETNSDDRAINTFTALPRIIVLFLITFFAILILPRVLATPSDFFAARVLSTRVEEQQKRRNSPALRLLDRKWQVIGQCAWQLAAIVFLSVYRGWEFLVTPELRYGGR